MKKLIISLSLSLFIVPIAYAATFYSSAQNRLSQNQTKEIATITIEANSDGEITAEHGINLILDYTKRILWNANEVYVTGSAVENGKIESIFTPTFSNDYKILHIPILYDFSANESIMITGLKLRAYNRSFGYRYLGLDIDGDEIIDMNDVNYYTVTDDLRSDNTPPYAPLDFDYLYDEEGHTIDLTWINPPDYDLTQMTLDRVLVRGGETTSTNLFNQLLITEYSDADVQEDDQITYKLFGADKYNIGGVAELTIDISSLTEEPIEEPAEEPIEEPETTELEKLDHLFNYYKIRYQIKCMPSGVPAPESSSTCLWARIDLVYAQELLERPDVDISLSERDIELMTKRVQYPEQRYQDNCVEVDEPASYCSALDKALQRIHYFID